MTQDYRPILGREDSSWPPPQPSSPPLNYVLHNLTVLLLLRGRNRKIYWDRFLYCQNPGRLFGQQILKDARNWNVEKLRKLDKDLQKIKWRRERSEKSFLTFTRSSCPISARNIPMLTSHVSFIFLYNIKHEQRWRIHGHPYTEVSTWSVPTL